MTIRLADKETGQVIGTLTPKQLDDFKTLLEEERPGDRDRYVDAATLDYLEEQGADPGLVALLRPAVAGREEGMEIEWREEK